MFRASDLQTSWGRNNAPGPLAFSGSYDKNYTQSFNVTSSVTVTTSSAKSLSLDWTWSATGTGTTITIASSLFECVS